MTTTTNYEELVRIKKTIKIMMHYGLELMKLAEACFLIDTQALQS
jgi:hypothetical protein